MASKNGRDEEARQQAAMEEMARQIRAARSRLQGLAQQNEDLARENGRLQAELDQSLGSKAWQLTAPLRKLHTGLVGASREEAPATLVLAPPAGTDPPMLDATVSFIIPTYNDGDDLDQLLPMLLGQRGFASVEVIAVDSGSEDGTPAKAEGLGARVVPIRKEDFSHSNARNTGAQNANGDYFVFTTQDALPTGPW